MKVFVVLAVFLPLVFCADPDPTTVCLPDRFETLTYNFKSNSTGRVSFDFTKNLMHFATEGISVVLDLTNNKRYLSYTAFGTCVREDMSPSELGGQCLPASATLDGTFTVGLGASAFQVQSWSYSTGSRKTRLDVLQQPNQPSIFLFEQDEENGELMNEFFFNTTLGISDESVFIIPSVCPPDTVV